MAHAGYNKQRFPSLKCDSLDCLICCEVVIDPMECKGCGKLFCKECIGSWAAKNPATKCPNRCKDNIVPIFSKALQKFYLNLDIRCSNPKCQKVVKLIDLSKHQEICSKVKCWNFQNCDKAQDPILKATKPTCSKTCEILLKLSSNFGNKKKMYEIIGEIPPNTTNITTIKNLSSYKPGSNFALCWDNSKCGIGVAFTDNDTHVFLKEQSYVFRTVISNVGFDSGVNYWEIIADPNTENELKIGVTGSRDFDLNSAFCDYAFGFAYYGILLNNIGLGQLRYNSNASGPSFGKKFKKEGILGVCLNMNSGTLSFALDGSYFGVAFRDSKLKSGMYFPAVSLLHCAGCKIRGGMQVPSYFKD